MDILLTLAAVILAAAIVVFFSHEFAGVFKKIFAIKGAKLVLPLALASYIVYQFELWVSWALYYFREVMQNILNVLNVLFPNTISEILLLMLLSIGMKIILDLIASKRSYKPYVYTNVSILFFWLVSVFVLILI